MKTKLKIANVIEEGRLGGPQTRIAEVAKHLKDLDIETTGIFPKYQSEAFKTMLDKYHISYVQFPIHRLTKDKKHLLKYFLFFFYEIFLLYRFLKKEKFDLVHCSGGAWQYKGLIAGKIAGIKTLWHLNDTMMPILIKKLFYKMSKFADGYIVSCDRVGEFYLNHKLVVNKPVTTILPPVDTHFFSPTYSEKDKFLEEKRGLKIVSVALVNPIKGFEFFIKMASLLNSKHDNLQFFIVGPHFDSQKNYVNTLYKLRDEYQVSNLYFYKDCKKLIKVLNSTDIYVCSSLAESGPISLFEAMSMGKAVISTDVGDVAKIIKNGESGWIVPTKNPDLLAEKAGILIENAAMRETFGEKARETAIQFLDISVATQKHLEAYHKLCSTSFLK